MTTSTTEPASNQSEAKRHTVDGMAEDDQEVTDDNVTGPEAFDKPRSPVRLAVTTCANGCAPGECPRQDSNLRPSAPEAAQKRPRRSTGGPRGVAAGAELRL